MTPQQILEYMSDFGCKSRGLNPSVTARACAIGSDAIAWNQGYTKRIETLQAELAQAYEAVMWLWERRELTDMENYAVGLVLGWKLKAKEAAK